MFRVLRPARVGMSGDLLAGLQLAVWGDTGRRRAGDGGVPQRTNLLAFAQAEDGPHRHVAGHVESCAFRWRLLVAAAKGLGQLVSAAP